MKSVINNRYELTQVGVPGRNSHYQAVPAVAIISRSDVRNAERENTVIVLKSWIDGRERRVLLLTVPSFGARACNFNFIVLW